MRRFSVDCLPRARRPRDCRRACRVLWGHRGEDPTGSADPEGHRPSASSPAIVRIEAGEHKIGTGFILDKAG